MDSLRKSVNRLDRERARHHRLTGEVVLPSRGDSSTRRVCSACFHVVDEQAERKAYEARVRAECCGEPGEYERRGASGWSHWHSGTSSSADHFYPEITACPKCGGELGEVSW